MRPDRLERRVTLASCPTATDGERHDQVRKQLLPADLHRLTISERRPVDRARERLVASRIVDHADNRSAVVYQSDRDAKERNPVGVVDGSVKRVDDPDAPGTGAGMCHLANLLSVEGVTRIAVRDREPHQVFAEVVDLGHHVTRSLGANCLQPLVALHLDSAGLMGQVDRQLKLRAECGRPTQPPAPRLRIRGRFGLLRGRPGAHQLAVPASRAISIVSSIDRLSSSSGRYDSSEVASSERTSLTVRIVAAETSEPAARARAAR